MPYIGHTADVGAFEILIVEFIDRDLQVGGSLKLDKSAVRQ